MMPPWLMQLRSRRRGRLGWRLWIPLFLLWPFLLLAIPIAIGLSMIVAATARPGKRIRALRFVPRTMVLLAALRGLDIRVADGEKEFRLRFF